MASTEGSARRVERVLLAVTGTMPQVVTETVWALKRDGWRPDRIEMVTTTVGLRSAAPLLGPDGPWATLFPARDAPPVTVFVPALDAGVPAMIASWRGGLAPAAVIDPIEAPGFVEDDDGEDTIIAIGDLVRARIVAATEPSGVVACEDTEVHVSIAGGRKTMSAHALLSLALVGRVQDEASHVTVESPFAFRRDFWHPDQGGLLPPPDDEEAPRLDPAAATVRLIRVPMPSIPALAKPRTSLVGLSLRDWMRQSDFARTWWDAPNLALEPATNTVEINGARRVFDPVPFAQLRYLAGVKRDGLPANIAGLTASTEAIDRLLAFAQDAIEAGQRATSIGPGRDVDDTDTMRALATILADAKDRDANTDGKGAKFDKDVREGLNGWFGSLRKVREELEEKFGRPLSQLLLPDRELGTKRGPGTELLVACPAAVIVLR